MESLDVMSILLLFFVGLVASLEEDSE